jgi:hypothetical protein
MTRTYIKDGKHKSIKNNTIYKELKTKLDMTPKLYLDEGKREVLKRCYKNFLDENNLDIVGNKIIELSI